jgi:hypothetical protein
VKSFSEEGVTLPALIWGPQRIRPEPGRNALRKPAVVSGSRRRGPRLNGPPNGFRLPVVSSWQLTPTTHAIEVEKPKAFTFGPTQFTFLQLLTEEGMDARPMSLATSPTRPHLEYAVRLSDSPYKRAFAALQPEDEVLVFGPIGDFVLHEIRPAILVAGGIGVTPSKAWPSTRRTGHCPFRSGSSTATEARTRSLIETNWRRWKGRTLASGCSTRSAAPPTAEDLSGRPDPSRPRPGSGSRP